MTKISSVLRTGFARTWHAALQAAFCPAPGLARGANLSPPDILAVVLICTMWVLQQMFQTFFFLF